MTAVPKLVVVAMVAIMLILAACTNSTTTTTSTTTTSTTQVSTASLGANLWSSLLFARRTGDGDPLVRT